MVVPTPLAKGQKFPLLAYAHGFDDAAYETYHQLFEELASWGNVIVAPLACKFGCESDCKSRAFDPPCFGESFLCGFLPLTISLLTVLLLLLQWIRPLL